MNPENEKTVEYCFEKARITDDLSGRSIIKYRESIKRFFKTIGDKKFSELENSDFDQYILKAKERGNENSGILGVLYALKWVMKKLQKDGIIGNQLNLDRINKPKIKKKDVAYLTKDEINKFIEIIENELKEGIAIRKLRTLSLYVFLLETGARIEETLSIKIKDIDFENNEVSIIGKGGKPRTLLFHKRSKGCLKLYLERRKDDNEFLFVTLNGRSKWSYNDVCRSFQRYKKLSGIKKNFTIHTFRHTFATQLLLNGVPINQVSFLLGHANLETTIKYYIGTIKMAEAKQFIQDKHFDFVPVSSFNCKKSISIP